MIVVEIKTAKIWWAMHINMMKSLMHKTEFLLNKGIIKTVVTMYIGNLHIQIDI